MKKSYLYRLCGALALLLGTACTAERTDECLPCRQSRSVAVRLAGTLPAGGLQTPLYLFRRSAGTQDDYVLDRFYETVADGDALSLPLAEMKESDYRFLMLAQPAGGTWLLPRTAAGAPFTPGAAWSDLRLESATGGAELEGYCGFTDLNGKQLLADGKIRLSLTRVAGQPVFEFFRIGTSLADPQDVVSPDVESVLDRVARIEIEYTDPTTALRFDDTGGLVPASYASEPIRQVVTPDAADFKVALPQADKGLGLCGSLKGALRMEGAVLLPSDSRLRVRMVFTYYDTTLICENKHAGAHDAACYEQRQLTLAIPADDVPEGLPVKADCFTVSRAGLRCDRIIDVPVGGGIDMDFSWL